MSNCEILFEKIIFLRIIHQFNWRNNHSKLYNIFYLTLLFNKLSFVKTVKTRHDI